MLQNKKENATQTVINKYIKRNIFSIIFVFLFDVQTFATSHNPMYFLLLAVSSRCFS